MRKSYFDSKLQGEVMIFDSLVKMCQEVAAKQQTLNPMVDHCIISPKQAGEGWTGMKPMSWDQAVKMASDPWSKATDIVTSVVTQLVEGDTLPRPKSRKRVRKYGEDDGTDVDLDRLNCGADWWEYTERASRRGPTTVTLLTNLDGWGGEGAFGIFWRGAAAIAATDILEQAGYMVELIMWCKGIYVYDHPAHNQLTLLRLKEAGQPLDMQALCCGLSAWFLRVMVFGSFVLGTRKPRSIGGLSFNITQHDIDQIDMEGAMHVMVPVKVRNLEGAVEAARKVIVEVIERNEAHLNADGENLDGYEELAY